MTETGKAPTGPVVTGWQVGATNDEPAAWPAWVPEAARDYIAHTDEGRSLRAIAREARVHPSTVLRRVRRVEAARDDPLVDSAIRQLSSGRTRAPGEPPHVPLATIEDRALPMLRRLAEPGTFLAVAWGMENGVILREGPGGEPQRLAVVPRELAEAMALKDLIVCADPDARIQRYSLASAGRSLLRRGMMPLTGLTDEDHDQRLRHMRSMLAESPLAALARRRDGDGRAFLDRDQVAAGERLREDFELAQQAGGIPWAGVLETPTAYVSGLEARPGTPEAALGRVALALAVLGPGLADVALRCCGQLEGIEAVERDLGWSARSGKVVLRIALERLRRHYRDEAGQGGAMIG